MKSLLISLCITSYMVSSVSAGIILHGGLVSDLKSDIIPNLAKLLVGDWTRTLDKGARENVKDLIGLLFDIDKAESEDDMNAVGVFVQQAIGFYNELEPKLNGDEYDLLAYLRAEAERMLHKISTETATWDDVNDYKINIISGLFNLFGKSLPPAILTLVANIISHL